MNNELAIVVNFYVKSTEGKGFDIVVGATVLGLEFLVSTDCVAKVLLVDGSAEPTARVRAECERLGAEYYHAGREMTYTEAYNKGWRKLDFRYIGMMANDILPHPREGVARLLDVLKQPDVGCTFPYMISHRKDWNEVQRPDYFNFCRLSCEPSTMSLNLNLFKREVLEEINGLDDAYLFGFQEARLIYRIRNLGRRVVMVGDSCVFHFDELNKKLGESNLDNSLHQADRQRWFEEYHDAASDRGFADVCNWRQPFATSPSVALMWGIFGLLPHAIKDFFVPWALRLEPRLSKYPARWGRRLQGLKGGDDVSTQVAPEQPPSNRE